jgi:hypothetical protein
MPKPIDRFLHTYKLMQGISFIGGGAIGTALAALGVPAAAAGAAAGALATGALVVGTGGLVLVALPVAYGLAKTFLWQKKRQLFFEKHQALSNDDFRNHMAWDCYWTTVVVIGYERTGKTQLKKRLRGIGGLRGLSCASTDNLDQRAHLNSYVVHYISVHM